MVVKIPIRQIQLLPGRSVLLQDISWTEFEAILAELSDRPATRIAYCDGMLEIMTPLPEHEYFKEAIGDAIKDIAETLTLDYESYGSTTWRRQAKQAGLEADNCFYFQNEAIVRGRTDINLAQDPPPDLALEIDITSKSLERLPIYARLGIPELWCYDAGKLTIYRLQGEEQGEKQGEDYAEAAQSAIFPALEISALPQLIETYRSAGRLALRQAVRAWVREQVAAAG